MVISGLDENGFASFKRQIMRKFLKMIRALALAYRVSIQVAVTRGHYLLE